MLLVAVVLCAPLFPMFCISVAKAFWAVARSPALRAVPTAVRSLLKVLAAILRAATVMVMMVTMMNATGLHVLHQCRKGLLGRGEVTCVKGGANGRKVSAELTGSPCLLTALRATIPQVLHQCCECCLGRGKVTRRQACRKAGEILTYRLELAQGVLVDIGT